MWNSIRIECARRPWWMNVLFLVCICMALFRVPFDFFSTPVEHDQEVWFGILLHGIWAKLTEPLHWAIYAAGAWGFWKMRSWMWPWAAVYFLQVAIGTVVWNQVDSRGNAWAGAAVGAVFLIPTIALWRSRSVFQERA